DRPRPADHRGRAMAVGQLTGRLRAVDRRALHQVRQRLESLAMSEPRLKGPMLACAIAFFAWSAAVLGWPWIAAADSAVNASFGAWRVELLLSLFLWLTALGASPAIVAVCLMATALLRIARLPRCIAPLWIAWLGGEATSWSM